jgi:hypothetical protein
MTATAKKKGVNKTTRINTEEKKNKKHKCLSIQERGREKEGGVMVHGGISSGDHNEDCSRRAAAGPRGS